MERLRSAAWPAPVRREHGGWLLRSAGGWSKRANSALALADPGSTVAGALAAVTRFAEEHGIEPLVQAPVGSPWSNRVLEEGWAVRADPGECLVLVAAIDDVLPPGTAAADLPPEPPAAWWSVFGEPVPAPGSMARAVLVPEPGPGGPLLGFGTTVSETGGTTGAVSAAIVADHVYVARLQVRESHRRRGIGATLMRDALAWARTRGARHATLDVTADNAPARALYAHDGWTEHHRYHYLAPPR
ncbi:hypothetical protein AFB00_06310 [Pseudonocardia sp. HH130630-07]|nr:hypothetical protein AFB00_06310 [Pseudonocardia sp. HH130630-07]